MAGSEANDAPLSRSALQGEWCGGSPERDRKIFQSLSEGRAVEVGLRPTTRGEVVEPYSGEKTFISMR